MLKIKGDYEMTSNPLEVKVQLKNPIIGFNGKPIKDTSNVRTIARKNPNITEDELYAKLPNSTYGMIFQNLLTQTEITDVPTQLKVYRWVEKIESKMTSNKGEMLLDIGQILELEEFIQKCKNPQILIIGPVMKYIEELKEKLNKKN